jgi:ERCC4-related helicase
VNNDRANLNSSKDYKLKIEPRIYQTNIFKEILDKNSLVVLPTGLGKTVIALMLIIYHLRKYGKKIIFLAPTKPLAEQHKKSIINNSTISEEEVFVYTGEKPVEKRTKYFKDSKVKIIVGTPQTILNDYMKGLIDFKDVSLIIFDEAHRAVGNYDYVLIAKEYKRNNPEGQILALTASPGSNKEKIKEMLSNLFIEKIEVRTYKSMDVKPYVKKIKTEWVPVELYNEYKIVSGQIKKLAEKYYNELKKIIDELYIKEIPLLLPTFSKLTKKDLLYLQDDLRKKVVNIKDSSIKELLFKAILYLNILIKLQYLIELLETQGKSAALDYAYKIVEEARAKTQKSSVELVKDEEFLKLIHLIEKIEKEHPKLEKLVEIIKKEKNEGSKKFIVFTQFRNTAKLITEFLNNKGIKAERFVGKTSRDGDKGLSQKEQIKLIERFRNNEFEVLVATSVAEEGIDIPAVDAVIFYEPVPSEIRTIQRRGRTGRQEEGKVYILVTKDTVDMAYYFSAKKKEKQMLEEIEELALLTKEIEIKTRKLKKDSKKELKIIVDDRERNAKLLDLLNEKFEVQRERLEVGDFIVSDRIVVERKTLEDFLASLLDKRIFEQIKKMKIAFEKPIIIVEGSLNIEDLFYLRNVHPNAIRGLLLTILVDEGIPILFTKNEEETVNLLEILARREQINEKRMPQVKVVKKIRTISDAQEALISGIPGINRQLAINLLSYFKTPKNIANASISDLVEVPLIGKEKAKRIFEVFNTPYDENNILKEEKEKLIVEEKPKENKKTEENKEKPRSILEFIKK